MINDSTKEISKWEYYKILDDINWWAGQKLMVLTCSYNIFFEVPPFLPIPESTLGSVSAEAMEGGCKCCAIEDLFIYVYINKNLAPCCENLQQTSILIAQNWRIVFIWIIMHGLMHKPSIFSSYLVTKF